MWGQWPGKEADTLPGATWEVRARSWRYRGTGVGFIGSVPFGMAFIWYF